MRINLTWEGRHDITAFALDRLGEVVEYKNETPNRGLANGRTQWLGDPKIGASLTTSPGETIPLKDSGRPHLNLLSNLASFWTSLKICAQQKRLAGIVRCVFEELVKRREVALILQPPLERKLPGFTPRRRSSGQF